jgi:hypothetical protein
MSSQLSEIEQDFIHCIVNLKMHTGDLVKMFGRLQVMSMLKDEKVQLEIANRKRYVAEEMFLKKQIDINTILELRPKAISIIQQVLDNPDHPDRTKLAIKILEGEFSMISSAGKVLGEKMANAANDGERDIKIIYATKDSESS